MVTLKKLKEPSEELQTLSYPMSNVLQEQTSLQSKLL